MNVREFFAYLRETVAREFLSKIRVQRTLKYALFLFLALLTQNMLFTQLRIAGVCPMILPAVAVAVGMFEGATWGRVICLFMGYFADMSFVENRVFFLILLPALSLMSAFISQFFINRRFFAFMGLALLALLITALLQMLKTLAGDAWSSEMLRVALLQTLFSLPAAALAYPLPARWSRE